MEKRFLDKVKDNATVRIWSEKTQQEKGDSMAEGTCQNCGISLVSASYCTVTMVTFLIYSMSRWISTCFKLWLYIGIPYTAALLLER
ncbi:hypothetical protein Gohar_000497 [Gossypium harknessii]|uniref:Uncharacterized protein n=1 Tax=Gossypium harknessii TaxID=34285 RepID=A0A7J9I2D6_9ROSI|nr:hypothetical protein [Gossypium harknessii]